MIILIGLLSIVSLAFALFVFWIRTINRSYAFGLALDNADRIEQRHYIELEQKELLGYLEGLRDKEIEKREKLKEEIRKDGFDPDRPLF